MLSNCPGSINIKGTPTLDVKLCPSCGREIELFSTDLQVECGCGFVAYNQVQSCISWCKYAKECLGDEAYEKYVQSRAQLEEECSEEETD